MVTREREQIIERKLAIHRLVDEKPTRAAIDAFIADHEFPLSEGSYTTFVYRGPAEAVWSRAS